jgi:hypothetical protein
VEERLLFFPEAFFWLFLLPVLEPEDELPLDLELESDPESELDSDPDPDPASNLTL